MRARDLRAAGIAASTIARAAKATRSFVSPNCPTSTFNLQVVVLSILSHVGLEFCSFLVVPSHIDGPPP